MRNTNTPTIPIGLFQVMNPDYGESVTKLGDILGGYVKQRKIDEYKEKNKNLLNSNNVNDLAKIDFTKLDEGTAKAVTSRMNRLIALNNYNRQNKLYDRQKKLYERQDKEYQANTEFSKGLMEDGQVIDFNKVPVLDKTNQIKLTNDEAKAADGIDITSSNASQELAKRGVDANTIASILAKGKAQMGMSNAYDRYYDSPLNHETQAEKAVRVAASIADRNLPVTAQIANTVGRLKAADGKGREEQIKKDKEMIAKIVGKLANAKVTTTSSSSNTNYDRDTIGGTANSADNNDAPKGLPVPKIKDIEAYDSFVDRFKNKVSLWGIGTDASKVNKLADAAWRAAKGDPNVAAGLMNAYLKRGKDNIVMDPAKGESYFDEMTELVKGYDSTGDTKKSSAPKSIVTGTHTNTTRTTSDRLVYGNQLLGELKAARERLKLDSMTTNDRRNAGLQRLMNNIQVNMPVKASNSTPSSNSAPTRSSHIDPVVQAIVKNRRKTVETSSSPTATVPVKEKSKTVHPASSNSTKKLDSALSVFSKTKNTAKVKKKQDQSVVNSTLADYGILNTANRYGYGEIPADNGDSGNKNNDGNKDSKVADKKIDVITALKHQLKKDNSSISRLDQVQQIVNKTTTPKNKVKQITKALKELSKEYKNTDNIEDKKELKSLANKLAIIARRNKYKKMNTAVKNMLDRGNKLLSSPYSNYIKKLKSDKSSIDSLINSIHK